MNIPIVLATPLFESCKSSHVKKFECPINLCESTNWYKLSNSFNKYIKFGTLELSFYKKKGTEYIRSILVRFELKFYQLNV